MTQYDLSRNYWDWAFENPELVKPAHTAIYFFAIEHCNRLGWREKFGLPTHMAMEAIGVKSYNSYIKHFDELVSWGFIKVIEYSKNQYSSTIIALSKNDKAKNKALDKALIKHTSKHKESTQQSTGESIDSIDKQLTIEQINNKPIEGIVYFFNSENFIAAWNVWLNYKKVQHKFSFKSIDSQQRSMKLLFHESHQSEDIAINMLDYAMAKGWQSWVPKDDVNFYSGSKQQKTGLSYIETDRDGW